MKIALARQFNKKKKEKKKHFSLLEIVLFKQLNILIVHSKKYCWFNLKK